jgi:serine/threonine protein kinase
MVASEADGVSDAGIWERAARIFGAARELTTDERVLFLDQACGKDADLRAAVDGLLRDNTPDSFLAHQHWPEVVTPVPALTIDLTGHLLKGRYRVEKQLGAGGQATVYLATDEQLTRPVVIKVMRASGVANGVLRKRFERELKALSRIDHPGVVGILDVGELADESPFLVIHFVNGVTLRELLRRGPLPRHTTSTILRQLAAALTAAHAADVVHADIKPENILLQQVGTGEEQVKLIDFGIAKIDRSELKPGITTVMVAGTVRYMAPEQFEGQNLAASDIYAFGLIACELLCGEPDLRPLRSKVPASVVKTLQPVLAYRAEDRPLDPVKLAEQLIDALDAPSRTRRYAMLAIGSTVMVSAGIVVGRRLVDAAPETRIIEKVGAFDPLQEGFVIHGQVAGTVVPNAAGDGYAAWQVSTPRQGYYYCSLTESQKRLALRRGWTLSARMRADLGLAFAGVDFNGVGDKYEFVLYRETANDIVRLQTQITPTFQGIDLTVPHETAYHLYELRFDPGLQSADLWIDGQHRVAGYRGHQQYQGDADLYFGAATYKNSPAGSGAFQSVRFEIHP